MVEDYLLGKGGYAYIQKSRNDVTGIFYVEEKNITIMKNTEPIYKEFSIMVQGGEYKAYEFIKLLRNTKDGASGIGLSVEPCEDWWQQKRLFEVTKKVRTRRN